MSKRYPPIYSIVAIIVLVIVAATNANGDALYVASTITMWIFGTLSAGAIAAMIHVWVKLHNIKKQKQKETA